MVICLPTTPYEYQPGMTAETTPILLIEILSESTQSYDWGTKLPCYKEIQSLQQVFFIEQSRPKIIAMEREAPNRWLETTLVNAEDVLIIQGQSIPLKKIYRELYF
jgi:Uma2 family endonuclease